MSWSNAYIGIPWQEFGRTRQGCDCWGLACVVYRDALGIELPSYQGAYTSAGEQREIAGLIEAAAVTPTWLRVTPQTARPFDLAVFRRGHLRSHIGIVVSPGLMLHLAREDSASIARFDRGQWHTRLSGIWRHKAH